MEQEEKRDVLSMPVIVHESDAERDDRKNKRLWITILILLVVLIGLMLTMSKGLL